MIVPTPAELIAIRETLGGLSHAEFGQALGIRDIKEARRVVRGWEAGTRAGKPYKPSGSAVAAIHYLLAMKEALRSLQSENMAASRILNDALPTRIRL